MKSCVFYNSQTFTFPYKIDIAIAWKFYPEQYHSDVTEKALGLINTDKPAFKEKNINKKKKKVFFTSKLTVRTSPSHDHNSLYLKNKNPKKIRH